MNMKEVINPFEMALDKKKPPCTPLYCTGYPESTFIAHYLKKYPLSLSDGELFRLNNKNYELIKLMGFDSISLWDYRRGEGGYVLSDGCRVDGWGRIFKGKWYLNEGLFTSERMVDDWEHLTLPSRKDMDKLARFLPILREHLGLVPVMSLPGLFEKTWQSMGLLHFSKCLKNNDPLIRRVITFFFSHLIKLIGNLQKIGADYFIIADDCAYNNKEFIPTEMWKRLFAPKYNKIVKLIHQHNQKVILHSDGYITNLIKIFVEVGFDAVQSLEPNAGVDIFKLFREFGNQICFIGNIDMNELVYASPEKIKSFVTDLLINAKRAHSCLIISPTQQINARVKPKNVNVMIKTTKEFLQK